MYVLFLIVTLTSGYGDGGQALQVQKAGTFGAASDCEVAGGAFDAKEGRSMSGSQNGIVSTLVLSHRCVYVEGQ